MVSAVPEKAPNWIDGAERPAASGHWFEKRDPTNGRVLLRAARSERGDVEAAVAAALRAQPAWGATPAVARGLVLLEIVKAMQAAREEIAAAVAAETGKSRKDAAVETAGAIALGLFYASEGQRLYGRTTTSAVAHRRALTVRKPIGIAGLIIAANTPIANVAWKAFPALVCGNAAVLKAAEDAPATAWLFGRIAHAAGLPAGVLDIVQGFGAEAGAPLVAHRDIGVVSFTGSTEVGRGIQRIAGERLARVSLELGGKNPFVVADDADLDFALRWALLSAFSNAGQRCASASRVIVFDSVYDSFRARFVEAARHLRVGPEDGDDLGPVINEEQLRSLLAAVAEARSQGGRVLAGGERCTDPARRDGYYMQPAIIEGIDPDADLSCRELFGPIAFLYRARGFDDALALANRSPYGLTACIHTRSVDRAWNFAERVRAGVAIVNAGTFGSEPHMPFGGVGLSGNGTREPGTEALDVYSELQDVYFNVQPEKV